MTAAKRWRDRALLVAGAALVAYLLSRFPLGEIAHACVAVGPVVLVTPLLAIAWQVANSCALGVLLDHAIATRALVWNRLVGEGFKR